MVSNDPHIQGILVIRTKLCHELLITVIYKMNESVYNLLTPLCTFTLPK